MSPEGGPCQDSHIHKLTGTAAQSSAPFQGVQTSLGPNQPMGPISPFCFPSRAGRKSISNPSEGPDPSWGSLQRGLVSVAPRTIECGDSLEMPLGNSLYNQRWDLDANEGAGGSAPRREHHPCLGLPRPLSGTPDPVTAPLSSKHQLLPPGSLAHPTPHPEMPPPPQVTSTPLQGPPGTSDPVSGRLVF